MTYIPQRVKILISDEELGVAAATFAQVSIPSGVYDEIIMICQLKSDYSSGTYDVSKIELNGDTTDANYHECYHRAGYLTGSFHDVGQADSRSTIHCTSNKSGIDAETFAHNYVRIFAVSDTGKNAYGQTFMSVRRGGFGTDDHYQRTDMWEWENASNVTTIDLDSVALGTNFMAGSRWRVWGVKQI